MNPKSINSLGWIGVVTMLLSFVLGFILNKSFSWWYPTAENPETFVKYINLIDYSSTIIFNLLWIVFFVLAYKRLKERGSLPFAPALGIVSISLIEILLVFSLLLTVVTMIIADASSVIGNIFIVLSLFNRLLCVVMPIFVLLSALKLDFTIPTKTFFIVAAAITIVISIFWLIHQIIVTVNAYDVLLSINKILSVVDILNYIRTAFFIVAFILMTVQGRKTPQDA